MNYNKLRLGSRVMALDYHTDEEMNDLGTVISIEDGWYYVEFDSGHKECYLKHELELIKE